MDHDLPLLTSCAASARVWPAPKDWQGAERVFVLTDPASGKSVARLPMATADDSAAAMARARAALGDGTDRRAILAALIAAIEAARGDFADAIYSEMGAPIDFARSKQVDSALAHLQSLHGAIANAAIEDITTQNGVTHRVRYEPFGLALLITPWNWPLNQIALKVGAALLAGCAMVLKPSEYASKSALIFAGCMARALGETGANPDLFQLVLGDGVTGADLVNAGADVISFTGSTRAGRHIAAAAGGQLIPVLLELGGKSANILFEDCDVPLAVTQGLAHCFRNSGQSCNAATRMLVDEKIYDRVVDLAAQLAQEWAFDAPDRSGAHSGPLVNAAQYAHVQSCIETAITQGARLVAGGLGRAGEMNQGHFARATVFADVTPMMDIFHQEVFGPVLAITPFASEAEAISLANQSIYGLAGYVQTNDADRALRVARALNVGMVQVNGESRAEGAPFGGRKASGYGREAGIWGIRAFQTIKAISGA